MWGRATSLERHANWLVVVVDDDDSDDGDDDDDDDDDRSDALSLTRTSWGFEAAAALSLRSARARCM